MVDRNVIFLSVPGLRGQDLRLMPNLSQLVAGGSRATLNGSFPCVTWPAQATMLTGKLPSEHGVIANGFYWRGKHEVEMWTAGNEVIESAQVWDRLKSNNPELTTAAWFPMLSKRCGADYVCMPAPVHNPDGSESLWCYTKPTELYGDLRDALGHFPLKHFWGPLAGIASTDWIVDSAAVAANRYKPNFFYLYLPHLDYAAQKFGPDSEIAETAIKQLDQTVGRLVSQMQEAYVGQSLDWVIASEYTIQPVDHVCYPNRALRQAGLLKVDKTDEGELIDFAASDAWCLVDHQFSHVFVRDANSRVVKQVVELFASVEGIATIAAGEARTELGMNHPHAGEVVLVSEPSSWQAYYYWLNDERAPSFARTVNIHRKPGYDPVELFFDRATMGVPLDATLVKGSHGVSACGSPEQGGVLLSTLSTLPTELNDTQVAELIIHLWDE